MPSGNSESNLSYYLSIRTELDRQSFDDTMTRLDELCAQHTTAVVKVRLEPDWAGFQETMRQGPKGGPAGGPSPGRPGESPASTVTRLAAEAQAESRQRQANQKGSGEQKDPDAVERGYNLRARASLDAQVARAGVKDRADEAAAVQANFDAISQQRDQAYRQQAKDEQRARDAWDAQERADDEAGRWADWKQDESRRKATAQASENLSRERDRAYRQQAQEEYRNSPAGFLDEYRRQAAPLVSAGHYTAAQVDAAGQKAFDQKLKDTAYKLGLLERPVASVANAFQLLSQGKVRAGLGEMATAVSGSPFAGAFAGAMGSALFFPLIWKLADAIYKIPQQIGERVGEKREQSLTVARGGAEWDSVSRVLYAAEGRYQVNGKYATDTITQRLQRFQATGGQWADQRAEARAAGRAVALATELEMAGLESSPDGLVESLKLAQSDDATEQVRGIKSLVGRDYLRRRLRAETLREQGLDAKNPASQQIADSYIATKSGMLPGMGGYDPERLIRLAEEEADAARAEQTRQTQEGWWRWLPGAYGEGSTWRLLPWGSSDSEASLSQSQYVRNRMALETQRGSLSPEDFEHNRRVYRDAARFGHWGETGRSPTDQELDDLEQAAIRRAGGEGLFRDARKVARNDQFPFEYNWTSGAGLAEQMQVMWSGAPMNYQAESLGYQKRTAEAVEKLSPSRGPAQAEYASAEAVVPGQHAPVGTL